MHRLVITLIIFFSLQSLELAGQKDQSKLPGLIPIQGVDWKMPDDTVFLAAKGKMLNSNIILMCESDHGHGASHDAKSRLLKSLIDSGDIKILYIEANWMNCERITEILQQDKEQGIKASSKFMQTGDLKYWVKTGFWDYLAKKIIEKKIVLRGIDIDGLSPLIARELYNEAILIPGVDKLLKTNEELRKDVSFVFDPFEGINSSSLFRSDFYDRISKFINPVIDYFESQNNEERIRQWSSILKFFYWICKRGDVTRHNKISNLVANDKQLTAFHSIRDRLMAELFLDYNKTDSGYRVACSVSAFHGLRKSYLIEKIEDCCRSRSDSSMFEIIEKRIPDRKIYSICFIATGGYYGINYLPGENKFKVKKPVSNSLENEFLKSSLDYGFYEFRKNDYESHILNAIYDRFLVSTWGKNFSALFFIREMYPTELFSFD